MEKSVEDLIIIGAGAAGLCAGRLAAMKGMRPLILEAGKKTGRKLEICGGGFANFTNRYLSPDNYLCETDPLFCKNILAAFPTAACIAFVEKSGLKWEEREHGRIFLAEPAKKLVEWLNFDIKKHGGRILANTRIKAISVDGDLFLVKSENARWQCRHLFLAAGSPARPKLGGCSECWRLAASLGHRVLPARAALTPLLFAKGDPEARLFAGLAGISIPALVHNGSQVILDDLLFTHHGLSGPAILRASLYTVHSDIIINFLPDHDFESLLDESQNSARTPRQLARRLLPVRLADALLGDMPANRKAAELSRKDRQRLKGALSARKFSSLQPAGLDKCEVCAGGVDARELFPDSLESRIHGGLHILGEMCAVTGELGGYNLHWAFASAHSAVTKLK